MHGNARPLAALIAVRCTGADATAMEEDMGVEQAPTAKGKTAAKGLKTAAARDEKKTEHEMGHDLAKGAKRFDERARSSDGKSAGAKQK